MGPQGRRSNAARGEPARTGGERRSKRIPNRTKRVPRPNGPEVRVSLVLPQEGGFEACALREQSIADATFRRDVFRGNARTVISHATLTYVRMNTSGNFWPLSAAENRGSTGRFKSSAGRIAAIGWVGMLKGCVNLRTEESFACASLTDPSFSCW
jgi:hypothetical protein